MPVAEPGPNPPSTKGQHCVPIHSPQRLRTKGLSWEAGSLAFILGLLLLLFPSPCSGLRGPSSQPICADSGPRDLGAENARGSPLILPPAPGQFAFRDDVPLVRLEVADEWVRPEQAVVRYRIETVFARSSWDWIGLYRVRRAGAVSRSGRELGA